jgi:hypothetical protein
MPRDPFSIVEYSTRLLDLLKEVPTVRLDTTPKKKRRLPGSEADLSLGLLAGKERWEILAETKSNGEPRMIRGAIQQLQTSLSGSPKKYGVIGAPYIGPRSQEICKEAGVGYLDLAGNCRLAFGQVFIERRGFPNPKIERRPLRTLFAPKAGRVLRVLLEDPKRSRQVQAMAREAQVSLGLAFKVKQRLLDLEYAREEDDGLRLIRPEDLLRQWAASYSYLKSNALDCFASGDPPDLERSLATYCRENRVTWAFTLFSGAARVAPFARYSRGFAYVAGDLAKLASELDWKPVSSGANFTILTPFDEGLLYGAKEVNGDMVVSDVQLYLDLAGYKGRGEEAATFILEQRLRARW